MLPAVRHIAGLLTCLTLPMGVLPATAAHAQEPAVDTPRRYLVEVIVFGHEGPDSSSGERWSPREFELPAQLQPGSAETSAATGVEYTKLNHLATALKELQADARYRPLTYRAWLQPLTARNQAPKVSVETPSSYRAGVYAMTKPLDGWLRVFESHLLFVEVDVTAHFSQRDTHNALPDTRSLPDGTGVATVAGRPSARDVRPAEFRIAEKRRVKLNEAHYFDHPKFGLLVRVSRAAPQAGATDP